MEEIIKGFIKDWKGENQEFNKEGISLLIDSNYIDKGYHYLIEIHIIDMDRWKISDEYYLLMDIQKWINPNSLEFDDYDFIDYQIEMESNYPEIIINLKYRLIN